MKTIRQEIIDMLAGSAPLRLMDIAQIFSLKEKEVCEHLEHISRSVKSRKQKLVIIAPECQACGFVFKNRSRFSKPGRCPECKSQRIQEPEFRLETI